MRRVPSIIVNRDCRRRNDDEQRLTFALHQKKKKPFNNNTTSPGTKRLVSLGKVAAPKPVNLPSQRHEAGAGNDPNVTLVGRGSSAGGGG